MEVWLPKKTCVAWRSSGVDWAGCEDASSLECCEHYVGSLDIKVVGQAWSSEVISLLGGLRGWAGDIKLPLVNGPSVPRDEGCVSVELRGAGFPSLLVLGTRAASPFELCRLASFLRIFDGGLGVPVVRGVPSFVPPCGFGSFERIVNALNCFLHACGRLCQIGLIFLRRHRRTSTGEVSLLFVQSARKEGGGVLMPRFLLSM